MPLGLKGLSCQTENYTDEQMMSAASYLHRQFLLNLDNFQRDLFYHRRYVHYLINHKSNLDLHIIPTTAIEDLRQEDHALSVLNDRLKTIRERVTTALEMVCTSASLQPQNLSPFDRYSTSQILNK
jgi:hypothetical protein